MVSFHWGYLLPAGFALIFGLYLSAIILSRRPENSSTLSLRLMLFCYGFAFMYLGGLAWHFDLSLSRFAYSNRGGKLDSIVFIFVGTGFTVLAAVRSRAGLIRDSNSLAMSLDDDIGGKPDITPEERVKKLRNKPDG